MRLHEITLKNFRQFAGEQRLPLTSDGLRPVSLVFGGNGAGKTTLLNAFTWALYGTVSEDVEEQQRMVSDGVWRQTPIGLSVELSVELLFDHDGLRYRLLRTADVRKESDDQRQPTGVLHLWQTLHDGSTEVVNAPQERVLSILPMGVSRFFFFNGERIEKLVQKGAYSEVQEDIKVLLDLEQVERALQHLPRVDRRLSADLKRHGGDRANEIQTAIEALQDQEGATREELSVIERDLALLMEEREQVTDLLRQNASVAPLQRERDTVAQELEEARSARRTAEAQRSTIIATRGFIAFTGRLSGTTIAMAEKLYERGALPAPLKREFVDQLLEQQACICGTSLADHSPARHAVQDWRQRAGLQAVETAWQRLHGQLDQLDKARDQLQEDLQQVAGRMVVESDRVERLEARKSELDRQLKDSRLEEVQELESKRLGLEAQIASKQQRLGLLQATLESIAKQLGQKETERTRAAVTDELATKARSRSELVQAVRRALNEILTIRADDMRRRLDRKLKDVFASISFKPYVPQLSERFELSLTQMVDGVELPVPKSTGENQILSLSFVAAVSELAREIRKGRRAEGESSEDAGAYPIVMDAAFGSLDENYQREVSRALAEMAPQLVVFVSKSQGMGHVVENLLPHVSHLGVIVTHTSQPDVGETIELEGMTYPYIMSGVEMNRAELKVIR
ncbi:DNA sulfur modification protein DndD [Geodermatophilus dictyosporus]|uniref:Nuclease SbcCD subunit C n=1 Tax=Geodermatophilus dictyosporus TaxID=1523247 RepID=A0A1I5U2P2_9ACTN|nr:AAA family ATPase [Geodermatophilus dictyosporus]SFP89553.1 DNA sulfur modification protein DndD [Geodermatophilus dictyosporus]